MRTYRFLRGMGGSDPLRSSTRLLLLRSSVSSAVSGFRCSGDSLLILLLALKTQTPAAQLITSKHGWEGRGVGGERGLDILITRVNELTFPPHTHAPGWSLSRKGGKERIKKTSNWVLKVNTLHPTSQNTIQLLLAETYPI